MFEKILAALESIAASLDRISHQGITMPLNGVAEIKATPDAVVSSAETVAPAPAKRGRKPAAAAVVAAPVPVLAGATLTPNITPEPVAPVVPVVAAPLASAPVPVTRETVRAALIAYSNKTSQDATLALLEKACGTRVMSKVPEEKFQVVLDALAGVLPVAAAAPQPFNT